MVLAVLTDEDETVRKNALSLIATASGENRYDENIKDFILPQELNFSAKKYYEVID